MTKAADTTLMAIAKLAGVPFLKQNRPAKVKEIYSALKRNHPDMPAEEKARIAARQGKPGKQHQGPPYKGPITPWKEGEKKATLEKTARLYPRACRNSDDTEFADTFKGTPFYKEALELQKEDAQNEAVRARRWAEQEKEMAAEATFRVKQADLEAKLAEWRYKNMGIGTAEKVAALQKHSLVLSSNTAVIEVLNGLLRSEVTAVAQYMVQSEMLDNQGYAVLAKWLKEQAIGEMKHAESHMERIVFLEGMPDVSKLNEIHIGNTVPEIFANNFRSEKTAVDDYNKAVATCGQLGDTGTRKLLEGILSDEEKHLDRTQALLDQIKQMGLPNFLAEQTKTAADAVTQAFNEELNRIFSPR
jgi:bacterioferritin